MERDYIHKVTANLHYNLQRTTHILYDPPTSVIQLHLLYEQENAGTSTADCSQYTLKYAHANSRMGEMSEQAQIL